MVIFIIIIITIAFFAFTLGKLSVKKPMSGPENILLERTNKAGFDSWEGGIWEASDPRKVSARLQLDYIDARGQRTIRSIRVREYNNSLFGGVLMGMCELRNADRMFRFDRIQSCLNLDSDQTINDVRSYLNYLYESSPDRINDLLLSDYIDVIKVVYYIAKADGQCRKAEKEVITKFLQTLVQDPRLTNSMMNEILKAINVPSIQEFKFSAGRAFREGHVAPDLLIRCCKEIVGTQNVTHPKEKEALDYLEENRIPH